MSHPIIFLWAHPRSMSTATERIMRERGDCDCLHEPFMYYYYIGHGNKEMPHFNADESRPTEFKTILEDLNKRFQKQAVFAKDMAYYVYPRITEFPEIAKEATHLFLNT